TSHQTIMNKCLLDRFDRITDSWVVGRQEPYRGKQQQTGIETLGPIGSDKTPSLDIKSTTANFRVDRSLQCAPVFNRSLKSKILRTFDRPVKSDPGHHL